MADTEDKVVELNRSKQSIMDMIDDSLGAPTRPDGTRRTDDKPLPSMDKLTPMPRPGDVYVAHARPTNKPVPTFHCVLANGSIKGFSYALLETVDLVPADEPGGGVMIVLVFGGATGAQEVRLTGRLLDVLYAYLGHRRIVWVREIRKDRDFQGAGEAVINRITFNSLKD